MEHDPKKLLAEALALPARDRAAIAGQLLKSLDEEVDEDAAAAWADEIARRVRELDVGLKGVPWAEARRRIRSDEPLR
jgi:putative addiction module component (TIGR02574 family)